MPHVMTVDDYLRACDDQSDGETMKRLASDEPSSRRYENAVLVRKVRWFRLLACTATYVSVAAYIWSLGIWYEILLAFMMLGVFNMPDWLGFTEVDPRW